MPSMYMTCSLSQDSHYNKCIKIRAIFITTRFTRLNARVGILLTCRKHLHDRIISLRGEIWTNKTFNPATLYWSVCTKPGKWAFMYLCVSGIDFYVWFWNCSYNVVFFFFILLQKSGIWQWVPVVYHLLFL